MDIEVTEQAADVLRRSLELAGIDPITGGVRLRGTRALGGGFHVQVELADASQQGEQLVEASGLRLFVDPSVADAMPSALVTLTPEHEIPTVIPQ